MNKEKRKNNPEEYNYNRKPSISPSQKVVGKSDRNFDELVKSLHDWSKRRQSRIELSQEKKKDEESKECIFYPKILKSHSRIIENTYKGNWKRFLNNESNFTKMINETLNKKRTNEIKGFFYPMTVNQLKGRRNKSYLSGTMTKSELRDKTVFKSVLNL